MNFIRIGLLCLFFSAWLGAFAQPPEQAKVKITGFKYVPAVVTIRRGGSVTFTNLDSAPHTVAPEKGAAFINSGRMLKNESKTITFTKAGRQPYYCDLHPSMKGMVNVE